MIVGWLEKPLMRSFTTAPLQGVWWSYQHICLCLKTWDSQLVIRIRWNKINYIHIIKISTWSQRTRNCLRGDSIAHMCRNVCHSFRLRKRRREQKADNRKADRSEAHYQSSAHIWNNFVWAGYSWEGSWMFLIFSMFGLWFSLHCRPKA